MSADIPYMGSKISLISKAEIRYEGVLYSIDAEESTVALAQVRSFGTEDRPVDKPLPAKDQVFDYIVFRGSDIKDLHVCDTSKVNQAPTDPAIVESSMSSNNLGSSNQQSQQQQLSNNPTSGQQPGSNYMYMSPNSYPNNQPPPPPHLQQQNHPYPMYNAFGNNYPQFGGNQSTHSGSRTPSPGAGPQNNHPQHQSSSSVSHSGYSQSSMPEGRGGGGGGSTRGVYNRGGVLFRDPNTSQVVHLKEDYARSDAHRQSTFSSKDSDQNLHRYHGESFNGGMKGQGYNNNYDFRYSRGRPPNRGYYGGMARGGRGGRGGMPRGYMAGRGSFRGAGRPGCLKFDSEFDFESSNAKFDKVQIEKELKEKLNIGNKENTGEKEARGGVVGGESTSSHDILNGAPLGSPTTTVSNSYDGNCYDKTKSFFDSISCEALDNKGHKRSNWKEERKLNFETFGLRGSSNYNHRYRGRNRGGFYNSGNRNGYGEGNYYNRGPPFPRPNERSWGNQQRGGGRGKFNWYNSNNNNNNNNNSVNNKNNNSEENTAAVNK